MKVDGIAVVLAIILLPIILIVTFYIQMQVDTIATENSYNTKLLDATYDAMSAFEINTANEKLSSVADSMRSIVLASNNVLLNTLATNFGMSNASKEKLQPYIPAVLYTMYDGYYIYAPTETAKVAEKIDTNGELTTTKGYVSVGDPGTESLGGTYGDIVYEKEDGSYTLNKDEAKKTTDYVLKSYVQYSARYKKANTDVTINYTLDNYLNIIGQVNDVYYTKTGYLTKQNLVSSATADGANLFIYNETETINKILGVETHVATTTQPAASDISVQVDGVTISANWNTIRSALDNMGYIQITDGLDNIRTISEAETYLARANQEGKDITQIQNLEYEIGKYKAAAYYASSAIFSNWVYTNLGDLTFADIDETAIRNHFTGSKYTSTSGVGDSDLYYSFENDTRKIFETTGAHTDPEDTESNFNTHKMEVIKNSIKYNLNLSISAYCKMNNSYEFSLPVLLDEEWDKILSNISIVSFMQGWDCGLDIYNNYQIVSSTNNELTVAPSEIYYVEKNKFNDNAGEYHRIDCPKLADSTEYISFKSKEVKYDKIYDKSLGKNQYDHKNLACYTCINTNNYEGVSLNDNKKLAKYIALAKERQNIYKTNALPVSEGYKIYPLNETVTNDVTIANSEVAIQWGKVKELQITIAETKSETIINKEQILKLNVCGQEKSVILDQKLEQTISVDVSNINAGTLSLTKVSPNYDVSYKIKSVKVIYK